MARRRRGGEAAMEQYQLERIRALVAHAAARVPLYEEAYRGVDVERWTSLAALRDLPIIDKRWVIDRGSAWWDVTGAPIHPSTTSGTTGEIFTVPWSTWARWRGWVQRVWMMREMRVPFFGRRMSVSSPRSDGSDATAPGVAMMRHRRLVPDTGNPAAVAAAMLEYRPAWVTGQPHELAEVASIVAGRYRPRRITSHGVSTDDLLRAEITRGFGTPALDIYGACEFLQIAWQCRAGDLYHLNHDLVHVEILDDDERPVPAGEYGHLVLTGLLNSVLPLVRYRVGDSGAFADRPCACGERLPSLVRVEGRTFDWLVDANGRRVVPQRLWVSAVSDHGWDRIERYRIRQAADRHVTVEIQPVDEIEDSYLELLREGYARVLGPGIPIEVRRVERMEVERGHRFRQFSSQASASS
jgi:phenylacetate-CoA ligase